MLGVGRVGKYPERTGWPLPRRDGGGKHPQRHTRAVVDGMDAEDAERESDPNLDQHAVNPSGVLALVDGGEQLRG